MFLDVHDIADAVVPEDGLGSYYIWTACVRYANSRLLLAELNAEPGDEL